MKILTQLNPQQSEAVQRIDSHLLVVAGAGSGKTRVLTHKIAFLIEACGTSPSSILAMTFSNNAANEMTARVAALLPAYEQPRWIGTFHSICLRILREFGEEVGLPAGFSIYDDTDQLSVIKRAMEDLGVDRTKIDPRAVRHWINLAKNEAVDILSYLERNQKVFGPSLDVVRRYEELLEIHRALDFGSLLTRVVELLDTAPHIGRALQGRWSRILIDEYQDTNRIQKELILKLAGTKGIVCAVGDEDQAIYGWRGARVENILEFESDFPGARVLKLEQNYRSTQRILSAANSVIRHNIGRRGKTLWTEHAEGSLVKFHHAANDHAEAAYVLDRIEEGIHKGDMEAGDAAIFYRTHAQSRVIEDHCRRRNRPYRIFGGVRFYDRAEVKDALAFLKLAVNPNDNVAFARIINSPPRGIGAKTLADLSRLAPETGGSLLKAIAQYKKPGRTAVALRRFYDWFEIFLQETQALPPAKVLEMALENSGYLKYIAQKDPIQARSRMENIEELLRAMKEFSEETEGNIQAYLERISLVTDLDRYDPELDAIVLMTVHNSKGMEFDSVFVVGLEEGLFPHFSALESGDPTEMEEERRLCYVAMTRARRDLHLTAAFRRRLYQATRHYPMSRFVDEIAPTDLVPSVDEEITFLSDTRERMPPMRRRSPLSHDEYRQESYDDVDSFWGGTVPFPAGSQVQHPQFGIGEIKKWEGTPDNPKVVVRFRNSGTKKLLLKFTTLERID